MKLQYIILGSLILAVVLIYSWIKTRKQHKSTLKKVFKSTGRTHDNLKTIEIKKEDLEQCIDLDELVYDLAEKYYPDCDDGNFDKLDTVAQTFVLILDADGQINNGGIIQFIDNSSGDYFHETIEAAKRINSEIFVELLTRAAEQFPNGLIPKDWDYRRNLYDELCETYVTYKTFEELTDEEKQVVLEGRNKFGDTIPLDQCRYEEKNRWSDTWEELDRLYYDNSNLIMQNLIDYLKKHATLVD